jgi:hypothetical protein
LTEEKRKVDVYKYHRDKPHSHLTKKLIGTGIFHQFGVDHEEYDNGPGNFTTAVVEMPDGTVQNIAVDLIVFVK